MTVWERAYEARPSWDIGKPQPVVVRLADAGALAGAVLDVGCGTGDHALELARRGLAVTGIDIAPTAIARARSAAAERGLEATFIVHDALRLAELGRSFDTILDVGCFHTLQPGERAAYAASLRSVTRPGGRCLLVCWSNRNPFGIGPARITQRAIREAFRDGWVVEAIEPETLGTRLDMGTAHAWLARLRAV